MRVVIDTNLLFDSVAPKGDKHWVLDSFLMVNLHGYLVTKFHLNMQKYWRKDNDIYH